MRMGEMIQGSVVSMACIGMLTAQFAQAAAPERYADHGGHIVPLEIRDVALDNGGILWVCSWSG